MTSTPQRTTRQSIAQGAADALEAALASPQGLRAFLGFDGFLDEIAHLVDVRTSFGVGQNGQGGYRPIATITDLARRIESAARKSTNIERVVREVRFGGNAPLMAGALGSLGVRTSFAGAVATRDDTSTLHEAFAPFASRCEHVWPIAAPGHTLCLEFSDGKVMMNDCQPVQAVTWERVVTRVGLPALRESILSSDLLGVVNWSLLSGVEGILRGMVRDVLRGAPRGRAGAAPGAPARPDRFLFIDLADPAKRTDADVAGMLSLLREVGAVIPVTLGLNLSEAERIARVAGSSVIDASTAPMHVTLERAAVDLRERLGLACVVIHPREGAAASDASGAAWFDGPLTLDPKLSTGAGDHFNAGFSAAQAAGLSIPQRLAVGVGVSGAYVRDAHSPSLSRLTSFLRDLPAPPRLA